LSAVPRREAWLRRHPLEATVVVFTAPFLPASLQALRVLRVSRVLRLLRLCRLLVACLAWMVFLALD
jgi:hypothetical protein